MTTSPERRRIGTGSESLVRPPMRNTAACPSLERINMIRSSYIDPLTILTPEERSHRPPNGQRGPSECPGVPYLSRGMETRTRQAHLLLVEINDPCVGFCDPQCFVGILTQARRSSYHMYLSMYPNQALRDPNPSSRENHPQRHGSSPQAPRHAYTRP